MKNNGYVLAATLLAPLLFSNAASAHPHDHLPLRTYAGVRAEVVTITEAPRPVTSSPRPAGYFQLAGAAPGEICDEVLAAFNEPGRYDGGDITRWLIDNSHHIDFASLNPRAAPGTQYEFPDLEYARVDIDADGADEHVYRLNSVMHSYWVQRLMIMQDELQQQPELLEPYGEVCKKIEPGADCGAVPTMIRFAMSARVPDKLPNEWFFTREGAANAVTADPASRKLIYVDRTQLRRNVASSSNSHWVLYRVSSGVVAVGVPLILDFAPPELLVFVPSRERAGDLQCVLMPRAWHKPEVVSEEP